MEQNSKSSQETIDIQALFFCGSFALGSWGCACLHRWTIEKLINISCMWYIPKNYPILSTRRNANFLAGYRNDPYIQHVKGGKVVVRYILHNFLCSAPPNQLKIYTLQIFPAKTITAVQISTRNFLNRQKSFPYADVHGLLLMEAVQAGSCNVQASASFQIWTVEGCQCLSSPANIQ